MPDLSSILKYTASVGNKSGSIPAAPMGLLKLKESIEGLPFQILTKSMSGILDQAKVMQGLQQLIKQMGGIENMGGQAQQILNKIQNNTATTEEISKAFGGVTTMTAGLSTFLSTADMNELNKIAPGTANTSGG